MLFIVLYLVIVWKCIEKLFLGFLNVIYKCRVIECNDLFRNKCVLVKDFDLFGN